MHFIKTAHLGSQRRNYGVLTNKGNSSVVSPDCTKSVVTIGGSVAAEADKVQAESLAKSIAVAQVMANQIAVTPPGVGIEAKTGNSGPRGRTLALYRDGRRRVIFDQFESWRHERRELLVQFERFEHHMRCVIASMVVETTRSRPSGSNDKQSRANGGRSV